MHFVYSLKEYKYCYVKLLLVMKMKFGDILRELIELNNLTQKQVGKDLNIAASTIGNYVNNTREPDHATLKEFAGYFNVSTDFLLGYTHKDKLTHEEEAMINVFRRLDSEYRKIIYQQSLVLLKMTLSEADKY